MPGGSSPVGSVGNSNTGNVGCCGKGGSCGSGGSDGTGGVENSDGSGGKSGRLVDFTAAATSEKLGNGGNEGAVSDGTADWGAPGIDGGTNGRIEDPHNEKMVRSNNRSIVFIPSSSEKG